MSWTDVLQCVWLGLLTVGLFALDDWRRAAHQLLKAMNESLAELEKENKP